MLRMMLPCDVTDCGARGGHFGVRDGDGEGGAGRVGRRRQGRHGLVGAAGRRAGHGAAQHGREHRPVIRDGFGRTEGFVCCLNQWREYYYSCCEIPIIKHQIWSSA